MPKGLGVLVVALLATLVAPTPAGALIPNQQYIDFIVVCHFSHRAADDPIGMPGHPGASHSHDFWGNVSTDAFSTYDSMRASGTSCNRTGDTAAYWMPTVLEDGEPVEMRNATFYYRTFATPYSSVVPFPADFRMIAGDPHATSPQRPGRIGWACRRANGKKGKWTSDAPVCPPGTDLIFRAKFPDCWNGRDLDSPDHRSHVAYRLRGHRCPPGYPYSIPKLSMEARVMSVGGPGISLSSGSIHTGHADFWNTWDQPDLEGLVRDCLVAGRHCGFVGDSWST